ncbi:glycosyl transferase family 2 [Novosphingobium nitrogenifigens DSM 19370]|uniref:Glycosyl transferase family 2 n=1 Tax=Novosphingobium nitrogenifigens DSM 19370 TaxID=983920 RepID=F1Z534_9SPHN|nr:glycosyltransferase family A protein [Novosphingobium nitrogenifigens]EGD59999.1 glycosyl transferase family 2 [Novosphingobium nitrogenifigens DSM 19370]
MDEDLVAVIIPSYNASATLDATLRSVLAQTHTNMEILVVDDGSTDDSPAIVEHFAAQDPRVRLIRQKNAGVAAARNTGWHEARADYLAFVDADDTWTRDKLERQLAILKAGAPRMGLVYSWYVLIDGNDRVEWIGPGPKFHGQVLDALIRENFIGNGSSVLVTRAAVEAANGFEPALRAANAQGCEDILFYCRVAAHFEFGVVEDYQIGYRQLPVTMSTNLPRMLRSWLIVLKELRSRHPDKMPAIRTGLAIYGRWVVRRAVHKRKFGTVVKLAALVAPHAPMLALKLLFHVAPEAWWEMVRWRFIKFLPDAEASSAPPPVYPYEVGAVFATG